MASDLNAWGVDWSDKHPLVFINGCHTVDLTPDDLLAAEGQLVDEDD